MALQASWLPSCAYPTTQSLPHTKAEALSLSSSLLFSSVSAMERSEGEGRVVCVTGASGFLASWLVKCLLEQGYHVRGTVRDTGDKAKTAHLWELPRAQECLQLWQADLLVEGSFDAAIDGCHGVFHTAMLIKSVVSDPQVEMIDLAVKGTLNVLQSCTKASSVQRVVLTSSASTIRFQTDIKPHEWLDESHWTSLETCDKYQLWYGKAKVLAERAAWDFAKKNNLNLVALLPSFIIGPVLPPNLCITASDVLSLLRGDNKIFGHHSRMGYVHIDDVATAHILLYENPSAKGRFLCSAEVLENTELAKRLAVRYPHLSIPLEFETHHDRPPYNLNSSKIKKLGLRFKTIEEMFDDCIASFKAKGLLA